MAHPINDLINFIEKRNFHKCDSTCKNFAFPNLKRACVLSEVFSVLQGENCFEYQGKD